MKTTYRIHKQRKKKIVGKLATVARKLTEISVDLEDYGDKELDVQFYDAVDKCREILHSCAVDGRGEAGH